MPVTAHVVGETVEPGALDDVFAELELLDHIFSPFIDTSEVSRFNRDPDDLDPVCLGHSDDAIQCSSPIREPVGPVPRAIAGNCDPAVTQAPAKRSRITGFVFRNWSGARDLNPGPHGPEI
jgi:hypothetical protein